MVQVVNRTVESLKADEKRVLQTWLPEPLEDSAQLLVMVITSRETPDELARQQARSEMNSVFEKVDARVKASRISNSEIDTAVEEAMNHVRGH